MVEQVTEQLNNANLGQESEQAAPMISKNQIDVKAVQQLHQDTFNIPKIELHTHIGGGFRPQTFMELVLAKGLDMDKVDLYNVDI